MYQRQFGLEQNPFGNAASGDQVYTGTKRDKAVANLKIGLSKTDAVVAVVGPAGVGKSTLALRAVEAAAQQAITAVVARLPLSGDDLLEILIAEFGINSEANTTMARFQDLRCFFAEQTQEDCRIFILVEDAAVLGADNLNLLTALTAADPRGYTGANLILMGDEGLPNMLETEALTRLQQRVRTQQSIEPFSAEETTEYISHRIASAGGDPKEFIDGNVGLAVFQSTQGVARVVDNLMDTALCFAFSRKQGSLLPAMVQKVARSIYRLPTDAPMEPAAPAAASENPATEAIAVEPQPVTETPAEAIAVEPQPVTETAAEAIAVEPLPVNETAAEPIAVEPQPVTETAAEAIAVEPQPVTETAAEAIAVEPQPATETAAESPELSQAVAGSIADEAPTPEAAESIATQPSAEDIPETTAEEALTTPEAVKPVEDMSAENTDVPITQPASPAESTPLANSEDVEAIPVESLKDLADVETAVAAAAATQVTQATATFDAPQRELAPVEAQSTADANENTSDSEPPQDAIAVATPQAEPISQVPAANSIPVLEDAIELALMDEDASVIAEALAAEPAAMTESAELAPQPTGPSEPTTAPASGENSAPADGGAAFEDWAASVAQAASLEELDAQIAETLFASPDLESLSAEISSERQAAKPIEERGNQSEGIVPNNVAGGGLG